MDKVRILDSAFTPFVKSASLREENAGVGPTHFEWESVTNENCAFHTDGNIRKITHNEIAWLIEPRHLRPENYALIDDPNRRGYMKAVLTYDAELLRKYPDKCLFYPVGGSSIALDKWGMHEKSKNVCMFVSDKQTTEGHKFRHEISKHFAGDIDFYGAGVGKPMDNKFEVLKDYKWCVVVESGIADNYFTEKLIDPISVGTIPIYCGAPNIDAFFHTRSAIRLFEGPKYLEKILQWTQKDKYYNRHIVGATKNLEIAKQFRIAEDYIYEHYPKLFGGTL